MLNKAQSIEAGHMQIKSYCEFQGSHEHTYTLLVNIEDGKREYIDIEELYQQFKKRLAKENSVQ